MLEIGMLWFDDGPKTIQEKVGQAVAFYTDKFGRKPTHCLVNPETLNGGEGIMKGVKVQSARTVMPDHYWIGIEDESRSRRSRVHQAEGETTESVAPEGIAA
jgi:hypothetical protein